MKVTGEGQELLNEKLHVMCPHQTFRVEMKRNAYRPFIGKPEGKKHLKDPGVD
jgi:hypothetical protein